VLFSATSSARPGVRVAGIEGDEAHLAAQLADVDAAFAFAALDDGQLDASVSDGELRDFRHRGSLLVRGLGWPGSGRETIAVSAGRKKQFSEQ
jgi:hypothetical protein